MNHDNTIARLFNRRYEVCRIRHADHWDALCAALLVIVDDRRWHPFCSMFG
jgi:hypothetical protein